MSIKSNCTTYIIIALGWAAICALYSKHIVRVLVFLDQRNCARSVDLTKHKNEQNHRPLGTVRDALFIFNCSRSVLGLGFGPDLGALVVRVLIRGAWLGQVGGAVCIRICLRFMQAHVMLRLMNSRHRKTLQAVFKDPVSGTIRWDEVEALLIAAGARLIEGNGSRIRFDANGETETFHRPHPEKEAKRYQIKAARAYLVRLGVTI
jgi:HicA toxin of bacterial toxin-antitoxin,